MLLTFPSLKEERQTNDTPLNSPMDYMVDDDSSADANSTDFSKGLPENATIVYMGKRLDARSILGNQEKDEDKCGAFHLAQSVAADLGYGDDPEPAEEEQPQPVAPKVSLNRRRYRRTLSSLDQPPVMKSKGPLPRSNSLVGMATRRFSTASAASTASHHQKAGRSISFSNRNSIGGQAGFGRRSSTCSSSGGGSRNGRRSGSAEMQRRRSSRESRRSSISSVMSLGAKTLGLETHDEAEFEDTGASSIRVDLTEVKELLEDGHSFAELKATLAESGAITDGLLKQILPLYAAQKRQEANM